MKLNQLRWQKAGMLPYILQKGEPVFKFMVPSDPRYGGTRPGIAKGELDKGESTLEAAIREAEEEIGLVKSNMKMETLKLVWNGMENSTSLVVYMCKVKNQFDFVTPHYETGETFWLTTSEFSRIGKHEHVEIVQKARSLLK